MAVDVDFLAGPNGFSVFGGIEERTVSPADGHQSKMIPVVVGNSDTIAGSIRDNFDNAFYIECHPGDLWVGNSTVRCLCNGLGGKDPDQVTQGDENWYFYSVLIPSNMDPAVEGLVWELHHPASLYNLANLGVAPFAIHFRTGQYNFRHLGGNGTVGAGYAVGNYNILLGPLIYGQWVDFLIHIKFSETGGPGNALVECFMDTSGTATFSNTPHYTSTDSTLPYCNSAGVHNVSLYHEIGFYTGNGSISRQMVINTIGTARRQNRVDAVAVGGGSVTAPPIVTEPGRFLGGDFQPGLFIQYTPPNFQVAQEEVMTYSGTIDAIKMTLGESPQPGTDTRTLCVWDKDVATGKPGNIIAQTAGFSFSDTSPAGDYGGPIVGAAVHRNLGDPIFIGYLNGGTGNIAGSPSDHPGLNKFYFQPRTYSSGPANWDPATGGVVDVRETIWVEGNKDAVSGTFGGMTVTDDFNRADTGPPPSGSWTGGLMA